MSSAVTPASDPELARRTMTAWTDSPHSALGMPMTAQEATAGCCASAFSTSAEYTFSPPLTIMSLMRSTT